MKKKLIYTLTILITFSVIVFLPQEVRANNGEQDENTSTLIVETDNKEVFNNYENIVSVDGITDNIFCINYKNKQEADLGLKQLEANDLVANVCKNIKVSMLKSKVEEMGVSSQSITGNNYAWGVSSTGINHYLAKLKSKSGLKEVKVAVLDTGINSTHEVFYSDNGTNKVDKTYSYNYVSSNNDVSDDNGHGTQVAGIISQSTSDNVKIIPVKVLDNTGYGNLSNILLAIINLQDNVDIINLSLGMNPSELDESTLAICEKVLKLSYDEGVSIVCAAGNDGEGYVCYPASSQYTMAVSSIDTGKKIADFSNYGSEIDFALPGVRLTIPSHTSNTKYLLGSGTSYSSPFLSAAIALVKTENNSYSINSIKNVLKNNAEDLGVAGKDIYYGYGSLNFDIGMFKYPVIANTEVRKDNKTVYVYAISGTNLVSYTVTSSSSIPSSKSWTNFSSVSTDINFNINVDDYGAYYIWVKNENGNTTYKKVDVTIFDDVSTGSWYFNAVKYVYKNNIMKGYNSTQFAPNDKMTRGMLVTILYRMEGEPKVTGTSKFPDVRDSSKYYYKAVKWATNNKIVNGYDNGNFGPNDNIQRQQLAVILNKYAKYKGKKVTQTNDLKEFSDSNQISNYAITQMKWAVGAGVISGNENKTTGKKTLNPKGNATRAEAAAMLEKYCKNVGR